MTSSVRPLGLYDLLGPEFLAGFTFPDHIDQYLKPLSVSHLAMTSDDTGVLYTGTVYFGSDGVPPSNQHTDPSGAVFDWTDLNFQFRLRVWREVSPDVQTVVNALGGSANSLSALFNEFGTSASPTDYPGLRFRLELLLSLVTFHLGPSWLPGVMDSTYHVVRDTTAQTNDVKIALPKMLFRYEQVEDFTQAPTFTLDSWGSSGFDAPSDLAEGELVSMDPPLAMHTSGRVAFSIQDIALDLSQNNTPAEILSHFGAGDDFQGVYIKAMQFYYSDADKDFAFNIAVRDALISFKGEVWLEAELDLMWDPAHSAHTSLSVTPKFLIANQPIQFNAGTAADGQPNTYQGGSVSAGGDVHVQLQVAGGIPPYTYDVTFTPGGGGAPVSMWDAGQNQAHFPTAPTTTETGTLVIEVTDSTSPTPLTYTNTLAMTVTAAADGASPNGTPADTPGGTLAPTKPTWDSRPSGIPDSYQVSFTPATSGTLETLVAHGAPPGVTVTVTATDGATTSNPPVSSSGRFAVDVPAGHTVALQIVYGAQAAMPAAMTVLFDYDGPPSDAAVSSYVAGVPSPPDPVFATNAAPDGVPPDGAAHAGADAVAYFVHTALDRNQPITIAATASYEGHSDTVDHNQALSVRRGQVAQQLVQSAGGSVPSPPTATGQTAAQAANRVGDQSDRAATITGTPLPGQPSYTLTGTLKRDATPGTTAPQTPATTTPPQTPPSATNSDKPPSLTRLSFRVRLERNLPVVMEVSGEIDFQKQTQAALQQAPGSDPSGSLDLQHTPSATANPRASQSTLDFTLNVTYDTATQALTETLTLGTGPGDANGLLQMSNGDGTATGNYNRFKNIFGALLVFTPILNAATTAIDPASAGEWSDLAISLGPPVLIGGLDWMNTVGVTLYGGSLVMRQNVPDGLSSAEFTAASVTFDYGVTFRFDIDLLHIHSGRNLTVRYKAVGFSLNFTGDPRFKLVFDTSKGYTLDLSDPSLFNLPAPLGDLLKIAEARIAQYNPLTLEADLVVKADLGVVTIDRFQLKLPLDGSGPPMVLPSGVHVNVPSALRGGGSVSFKPAGGFEGNFDLTVVPVNLRVAASLGVEPVSDGQRSATAVFLGVEVDFPTPIILGDTGLGIFGLFGLFGMHFTRNLPAPTPGSAIGPDLQWLLNAGGQPQFLSPPSNPAVENWVPKLGSWELGIGALLGTVDGFLMNMRGMVMLELPGPQIIVTVNLQIVTDLPGGDSGVDTDSLTVGILGILDIDFNLQQITIGVSVNFDVDELIVINVPISIFFSLEDPVEWHIWIGTIQTPVSAKILGIVKGSGYLMMGGQEIDLPAPSNAVLPGVAVALGLRASVIWGSESAGIYLEVTVGADLGVSFSPHLFIVGQIYLSGQLRLLIVSIGATGTFLIQAPTPFYLDVRVCGSVSFFFFSISACVEFSIGSTTSPPPPPALIGRMYLQSYAPVIPSGQGGSRPIDASLGDATETVASGLPTLAPATQPSGLGPVPIDSVPVLQFLYAADATTITSTFTTPVPQCAALPTSLGGAQVSLGGGRTAAYQLKSLSIDPPLPSGDPAPPAVWRKNTSQNDTTATRVDLALFSRDPNLASHALERSTTLTNQLTSIWGGLCTPIAPPACVLWTFCGQRLGPARAGWDLTGIPTPDPPGTTRAGPVPTALHVDGPDPSDGQGLLGTFGPLLGASAYQPAEVIGVGGQTSLAAVIVRNRCWRGLELPELVRAPAVAGLEKELLASEPQLAAAIENARAEVSAQQQDTRWVRFDTGAATSVQLYLAVAKGLFHGSGGPVPAAAGAVSNAMLRAAGALEPPVVATVAPGVADVVIRERHATGALLRESTLESLGPHVVAAPTDLPSAWTDPSGPWATEIAPLYDFFTSRLSALVKLYVELKPLAQTTVIEVAEVGPPVLPTPTVVIGAIVACPTSEADRYETGIQVQTGQVSTLEGYLDGGSPVPLLAPNTTYTITAEYDVTTTEADGTTTPYTGVQQGFQFSTDAAPPPKLDPWVMSCSPANNEEHVFYEDPVTVVFNDQEALQLWNAYDDKLVLDLRAADGLNDPTSSVQTTVSVSGLGPAGYDSLLQLVKDGKLPCVGASTAYQNQQYTADVKLRPTMAYTLDIVTDPAAPAPPGSPQVPLYRTRFTTSNYPSLQALAADLGGSSIAHRHLTAPLTTLTAPTGGVAAAANDQDIESAFLAAGEQALPAPSESTITIYWIPGTGGAYVPYCLLLDCTEPLWRTRQEPALVPVDPADPSFTIVQITPTPALQVVETGGSSIAGYLYSTSGTRTIAFLVPGFAPPPAGTTVTLALHRPASTAFGLADAVATIVAVTIGPQAPWESDHV
ncbi:MAG TPA: hypothetical protein VFW09_03970 [Solirubrobacteraceae bacterium]|nr:hypothetical protein [Solirubrobacteraceae bacterium]